MGRSMMPGRAGWVLQSGSAGVGRRDAATPTKRRRYEIFHSNLVPRVWGDDRPDGAWRAEKRHAPSAQ